MKAIIVAAGKGSRLHPLTENTPKALLRVNGATILEHQIFNLRSCGIEDIVVVVGYQARQIERAGGSNITYVYNPFYAVSNNLASLWLAKNHLNDDLVYMNGDIIFSPHILTLLSEAKEDICMVVDRKECVDEDMKVSVGEGFIVEVNKTMDNSKAFGEYVGIARFSKNGALALAAALDEIVREGDLTLWFESAIERLIAKGHKIYKIDTNGRPWIEIDFLQDLERARTVVYPSIRKSDVSP